MGAGCSISRFDASAAAFNAQTHASGAHSTTGGAGGPGRARKSANNNNNNNKSLLSPRQKDKHGAAGGDAATATTRGQSGGKSLAQIRKEEQAAREALEAENLEKRINPLQMGGREEVPVDVLLTRMWNSVVCGEMLKAAPICIVDSTHTVLHALHTMKEKTSDHVMVRRVKPVVVGGVAAGAGAGVGAGATATNGATNGTSATAAATNTATATTAPSSTSSALSSTPSSAVSSPSPALARRTQNDKSSAAAPSTPTLTTSTFAPSHHTNNNGTPATTAAPSFPPPPLASPGGNAASAASSPSAAAFATTQNGRHDRKTSSHATTATGNSKHVGGASRAAGSAAGATSVPHTPSAAAATAHGAAHGAAAAGAPGSHVASPTSAAATAQALAKRPLTKEDCLGWVDWRDLNALLVLSCRRSRMAVHEDKKVGNGQDPEAVEQVGHNTGSVWSHTPKAPGHAVAHAFGASATAAAGGQSSSQSSPANGTRNAANSSAANTRRTSTTAAHQAGNGAGGASGVSVALPGAPTAVDSPSVGASTTKPTEQVTAFVATGSPTHAQQAANGSTTAVVEVTTLADATVDPAGSPVAAATATTAATAATASAASTASATAATSTISPTSIANGTAIRPNRGSGTSQQGRLVQSSSTAAAELVSTTTAIDESSNELPGAVGNAHDADRISVRSRAVSPQMHGRGAAASDDEPSHQRATRAPRERKSLDGPDAFGMRDSVTSAAPPQAVGTFVSVLSSQGSNGDLLHHPATTHASSHPLHASQVHQQSTSGMITSSSAASLALAHHASPTSAVRAGILSQTGVSLSPVASAVKVGNSGTPVVGTLTPVTSLSTLQPSTYGVGNAAELRPGLDDYLHVLDMKRCPLELVINLSGRNPMLTVNQVTPLLGGAVQLVGFVRHNPRSSGAAGGAGATHLPKSKRTSDKITSLSPPTRMIREHYRLAVMSPKGHYLGCMSQLATCKFIADKLASLDGVGSQTLLELGLGHRHVQTIGWRSSLLSSLLLMHDRGLSAMAIVDDMGKIAGSISCSDVRYLFTCPDLLLTLSRPVSVFVSMVRQSPTFWHVNLASSTEECAHSPCHTTTSRSSVEEAVAKMIQSRVRRLWIVNDNHQPIGLLSISDLIKFLLPEGYVPAR